MNSFIWKQSAAEDEFDHFRAQLEQANSKLLDERFELQEVMTSAGSPPL